MKKIIIAAIISALLCGCSNTPSVTNQDIAKAFEKDFSAKVTAAFGENETKMSISKNGTSISFFINSPKELSGMELELFDEHAVVRYEGMEQKINTGSLPKGAPFLLLEELFDSLADAEDFTLSTDGEILVAAGEGFSATLSAEDFSVINAEFTGFATVFDFSEWAFEKEE